jgi:hypothetical protein
VIVTNALWFERVWWQIVIFPLVGIVVVVDDAVVSRAIFALLAIPTPTDTPEAANKPTATAPPRTVVLVGSESVVRSAWTPWGCCQTPDIH